MPYITNLNSVMGKKKSDWGRFSDNGAQLMIKLYLRPSNTKLHHIDLYGDVSLCNTTTRWHHKSFKRNKIRGYHKSYI